MQKSIFHNKKLIQKNEESNNSFQYRQMNGKKTVNINTLLNRVKTNQKNEKKQKAIFFCQGLLVVSLMGIFISIIK